MKASGAYGNLVQGVSQQTPQERRDGQVTDMVNMLPDPVNGLSRRHGSKFVAEWDTGLSVDKYSLMVEDTNSWRKFEYSNAGRDYVLLFRSAGRILGSTLPSIIVYNSTDRVFLPLVRPVVDAVLDTFESGGASAITSVGKYVLAAGNTILPTASTTDLWGAAANQNKAVLWIRGGAYSRTFKASVTKTDDTVVAFEYTTPKSSYGGVLDTSAVPAFAADPAGGTQTHTEGAYIRLVGGLYQHTLTWGEWSPTLLTMKKGSTVMTNVSPGAPANSTEFSWAAAGNEVVVHSSNLGATDLTVDYTAIKTVTNPNYATIVSGLTNDYNTAVTTHIGTAAEAIQPQAIAEQLKLAAVAAGLVTAIRQDSTVIFDNVKAITVQDGGDGSLVRGVANEVSSADQVSAIHYVGKVVKVRAKGSEELYYLKAQAKDSAVVSGFTEVTWVEGAGVSYAITNALIYGLVSGGTFYLASSASLLNSIIPGTHPAYVASSVGDASTSPLPFFVGRKISYLGVFQDRLLVGAGSVVRASKVGDYLNFFRTSVLTAPANDAFEMLSQGSEDDELRHGVLYDRDLVIFGKRQYAISGRTAVGPTSANMPVMSSHEGASDIPPIAAGGLIFYTKQGAVSPSVNEIRPGQVAESPESYPVSSQLDTYFSGQAIELVTMAKPAMLFLRTTGVRNSVYAFTYTDTTQGRAQDAWGRWPFSAELGVIIGMSPHPSGLLLYTLRVAHDKVWVVADVCPVDSGLATYPYLDSIRPWAVVAADNGSMRPTTPGELYTAFDTSTEYRFLGSPLAEQAALVAEFPLATGLWAGAIQESGFTPTNPFVRDRRDHAVTTGRLTVTRLSVSFTNSSGFVVTVQCKDSVPVVIDFNGLLLGSPSAILGRVPVDTGQTTVPVGKETRDYSSMFRAKTWLPLTITSMEWVGQFFNNSQRL